MYYKIKADYLGNIKRMGDNTKISDDLDYIIVSKKFLTVREIITDQPILFVDDDYYLPDFSINDVEKSPFIFNSYLKQAQEVTTKDLDNYLNLFNQSDFYRNYYFDKNKTKIETKRKKLKLQIRKDYVND